ncbi:hypothetical protein, partial [Novilysobacter arseniciresistens]|uniref:hypothetical protein n=1 Tax=Novilysobacter arseniciresistens TaxID=1385522 RepID=UPI00193A3F3C
SRETGRHKALDRRGEAMKHQAQWRRAGLVLVVLGFFSWTTYLRVGQERGIVHYLLKNGFNSLAALSISVGVAAVIAVHLYRKNR